MYEEEFLGFICYMEVKGEYLEYFNVWKKEFLEMLENVMFKSYDKKFYLKGLFFFMFYNSVVNGDF